MLQMFEPNEIIYYTLIILYLYSLQNVWCGFALFLAKHSLRLESELFMYVFTG